MSFTDTIPTTLDDCFPILQANLNEEDLKWAKKDTNDFLLGSHFSLGMYLRNNWGLWSGSKLAKWFNNIGIFHPDDMSGIILTSFCRWINNKPILLDEQVRFYQNYWKEQYALTGDETLKKLGGI